MAKNKRYNVFPIMAEVNSSLKTINFYVIETNQSLMLVDAGLNTADCRRELDTVLQTNGFSIKDITEIVLTHNHVDHVGLVNWITKDHPIPIYASKEAIPRLKRDEDFMEMRVEFFAKLYKEMDCGKEGEMQSARLKEAIEKNRSQAIKPNVIPIGEKHNGLEVLKVPGHAPDHIALFDINDAVLFSGDLIIDHVSSNALIEPDYAGKRLSTVTQQKASLEKVREAGVKRIYPGHGKIIDNPKEILNKRLAGIDRKAEKVKKLVMDGHTTGSNIAKAYYGKMYYSQFSLVMSVIIGHLDYLEEKQQIKKELKNGIWHYVTAGDESNS